MNELSLEYVKAACPLIRSRDVQGTGYLVRPDRVVTCAHVTPTLHAKVSVEFTGTTITGMVEALDETEDWAIVRLDAPRVAIPPLRCAPTVPVSTAPSWVSFGFPAVAGGQGIVIEGHVRDPHARDASTGRSLIQLYSPDAAAGMGPRLHGFSGAPVVCRGKVIGHLRRVVSQPGGGSQLGLIFACPASSYVQVLPTAAEPLLRPPSPGSGYDPIWYVHREQEEKTALKRLESRGSPVVLQAPQTFGKNAVVTYLQQKVNQMHAQAGRETTCLRLDLAKGPRAVMADFESLLTWIFGSLQTKFPASTNSMKTKMGVKRGGDSLLRFRSKLESKILAKASGIVLLILENVDDIHDQSYQQEFYGLLRTICEDTSENYMRLRLMVSVSREAAYLERTDNSSFFALAHPILLGALTQEQLAEQAELYGFDRHDQSLGSLFMLTAGHPELTRWALYEAHLHELSIAELLSKVDGTGGIFHAHLQRLRMAIDDRGLRDKVMRLLQNPRHSLDRHDYNYLYRKGLIHEQRAGEYRFRCPLYESYFRELLRS